MTKKELQAFAKGYDIAIFRSKKECPFVKQPLYKSAWEEGFKRGEETLKFHRGSLRRYVTAVQNLNHYRRDHTT